MTILVTGATGFVGLRLCSALVAAGEDISILSRSDRSERPFPFPCRHHQWDHSQRVPRAALEGVESVVHLAGEPIASGYWSTAKKRRIRASRVESTKALVSSLQLMTPPRVLVCASAVGFYGDRGDEVLTESSGPGTGFLPDVCQQWEAASQGSEFPTINLRIGIVMGRGQGFLKVMGRQAAFKLVVQMGSGRQWLSWIHVDDLVGLILFCLKKTGLSGPLNAVAPQPAAYSELWHHLKRIHHVPFGIRVPQWPVRLGLGQMSSLFFDSQRVLPDVALKSGFDYSYVNLSEALEQVFDVDARAMT